jgi:hypothetical protein
MHYKYLLFTCIILMMIGCSQNQDDSSKQPDKVTMVSVDTLFTFTDFETHNIAQPTESAILENSSVAIVDFDQKQISLVSKSGDLITTFGREGRGPGEFIRIDNLFVTEDVIHVIDTNQNMISKFDTEGNFINGHAYKSAAILKEVSAIDRTKYIIATGGVDSTLLSVTDFNTDSTFYFGTPKGESIEVVDFQESLNQLKNGEIPGLYKNMVTLRTDNDHIYAFLNAYSILQKYDQNGKLVWEQKIELPYNEDIFRATVEKAKNSPGGLPAYTYINDLEVIDKEIVILSNRKNSEVPQQLIKVNSAGEITDIYTLPAHVGYLAAFDVDNESNTVYFASSEDGMVYKSPISL